MNPIRPFDPVNVECKRQRLAADDFRAVTGCPWVPGDFGDGVMVY